MDGAKEWKLGDDELYFKWLIDELSIPDEVMECDVFTNGLMDRLKTLGKIPFSFSIPTDYNREFDGKKLRSEYYGESDSNYILEGPSSVLEVLIGLSKRVCEDILGDDAPWNLFLIMIRNLGIFNKDSLVLPEEETKKAVDKWIERDFDFDGKGSPFPLSNNNENIDQRKIGIWQQLSLYLDDIKYSLE